MWPVTCCITPLKEPYLVGQSLVGPSLAGSPIVESLLVRTSPIGPLSDGPPLVRLPLIEQVGNFRTTSSRTVTRRTIMF